MHGYSLSFSVLCVGTEHCLSLVAGLAQQDVVALQLENMLELQTFYFLVLFFLMSTFRGKLVMKMEVYYTSN